MNRRRFPERTTKRSSARTAAPGRRSGPSAWTLPSRSRSSRRSTAIWKAGSVEKFTILLYNKVILVGINRN
nr:MAG TPA: hypothetical protein [Caudoviricetes sp.]